MRQDHIPRGRTIPMGAVPVLARGLGHTAPTYSRRRPGSPSNGFLGSALRCRGLRRIHDASSRRQQGASAPTGAGAPAGASTSRRRGGFCRAAASRKGSRSRGSGAHASSPPSIPSATSRTRCALLAALADAGFATALPVTVARGAPLAFRRWRPGEPTRPGPDENSRAARPRPAEVDPGSAVRAARRVRPARPSHRLRRRPLRPHARRVCAPQGRSTRSASPIASARSRLCPTSRTTSASTSS